MKKISLEHSIRKIITESVGNINEPNGPPKAVFNKPVQIEPPTGEEHPDVKALNVSNQRKNAKQQDSQTRSTFAEGIFDDINVRGPNSGVQGPGGPNPGQWPGTRTPNAAPNPRNQPNQIIKDLEKQRTQQPPQQQPPQQQQQQQPPAQPQPQQQEIETNTQRRIPGSSAPLPSGTFREGYISVEHSIRNVVEAFRGGKARGAEGRGAEGRGREGEGRGEPDYSSSDYGTFKKPGETSAKPEPAKPETEAPAKPEPAKPETEAPAKPEPAKPSKPESKGKEGEGKGEEARRAEEAARKAEEGKKGGGSALPLAAAALLGGSGSTATGKDAGSTSVGTYLHGARARMVHADDFVHNKAMAKQITKKIYATEEANMKDGEERKKIEYVARGKLDAKATLGRQGAYKTRIIDEAEELKPSKAAKIKSIVLDKKEEKLGINPVVETEPRLKPLHMAEQQKKDDVNDPPSAIPGVPFTSDVMRGSVEGIRSGIEKKAKEILPPETVKDLATVGKKIDTGVATGEKGLTSFVAGTGLQKKAAEYGKEPVKYVTGQDYGKLDPESKAFQQKQDAAYTAAILGKALPRVGTAGATFAAVQSLGQDPSKNETEGGSSLGPNVALAADALIKKDVGERASSPAVRAAAKGLNLVRKFAGPLYLAHSLLPKSKSEPASSEPSATPQRTRELDPAPYSRKP